MASPSPVEALRPGDHACLTFSDAEERLDIVAAFVRDGLARGDQVRCFTDAVAPEALSAELAARGVRAHDQRRPGQLAILGTDQSWLAHGTPDATAMIDALGASLDDATRAGYGGLRVTADMSWATRPLAAVDQLVVFESEVARLFADGRLTAICQYDRQSFDAVTLAFAANGHPRTVAATVYHEDPVLRVCRQHSPPGIRVAGEIDYTRADVLSQALGEALRLDHDLDVNLVQLRFMDAAVASRVVHAALSLPAGRRMTVRCDGTVYQMLRLAGAHEVTGLRVLRNHGQP